MKISPSVWGILGDVLVTQTTQSVPKKSASWQGLSSRFGLARSMGCGKREKEGKQGEKEGSQDKPSPREKERQLKSAKREAYEIPSIASY